MNYCLIISLVTLVSMVAGNCPPERIRNIGNCSYRIHCIETIRDMRLPKHCLESLNEAFTVDVKLFDAVTDVDYHHESDFLSLITSLQITGKFTELNNSLLQYTNRLQHLTLVGNQIETIIDQPFFYLNDLEVLDMSYNKLSNINRLFQFELQPNRMKKLLLAHNKIRNIADDAFAQLVSLTELDLSYNFISDLTAEPFSNLTSLQILRLNNNNITNLNGAVNNLHNLMHLYLKGNQIHNIDVESLNIIIHLETFDVSYNNLDKIKPTMFSRHWKHLGSHSVCKIILSNNNISSVPNGTAKEITSRFTRHLVHSNVLTELDLSKNRISVIEYKAFQSLIRLVSLDLSNNQITDFIINPDDVAHVKYLNLSYNHISQLYFETFLNMNNLQNLDLSNNSLADIPKQTFNNNQYLKYVNMTHNAIERLDSLHINIFHPEGGVLDLSGNGLWTLKIPYGEGLRLSILLIHSNNIRDVSSVDLEQLRDLKMLDMSRNMIQELHEFSLHLPSSLNYLDLSCNLIQIISPSAFMRLSHLKILYLSNNKIKSIDYGSFSGLKNLLNLDLSLNNISILDSRHLMDLKSLTVLSLRNNGLNLIEDKGWYTHSNDLTVYLDGNNFTCEWLAAALKNFNNGFSKMRPKSLEPATHSHSLGGISCKPEESEEGRKSLRLQNSELVMADERLLVMTQKILEAVKEQTHFLEAIWRPVQVGTERSK